MFRTLRETGPAVLVPAAWLVVAASTLGVVSHHALFVAHIVMSVLLVAFLLGSRGELDEGVLRGWKVVILAGTPVTLAGVTGFVVGETTAVGGVLLTIALYGWVILPAAGLAYTGRRVQTGGRAYEVGAGCCVVGAVVVALGGSAVAVATGIGVVGIGQTIGIITATRAGFDGR